MLSSYLFGNNPGESKDIISELCPSIVVICLFMIYYEVYDVMGVGIAKINNSDMLMKKYEDTATFIPEAGVLFCFVLFCFVLCCGVFNMKTRPFEYVTNIICCKYVAITSSTSCTTGTT